MHVFRPQHRSQIKYLQKDLTGSLTCITLKERRGPLSHTCTLKQIFSPLFYGRKVTQCVYEREINNFRVCINRERDFRSDIDHSDRFLHNTLCVTYDRCDWSLEEDFLLDGLFEKLNRFFFWSFVLEDWLLLDLLVCDKLDELELDPDWKNIESLDCDWLVPVFDIKENTCLVVSRMSSWILIDLNATSRV